MKMLGSLVLWAAAVLSVGDYLLEPDPHTKRIKGIQVDTSLLIAYVVTKDK